MTETHNHSLMILYLSPVPSPMVTVSPIEIVLVSGSFLHLTCSIQPHNSVNTDTNVMYSWDAPNNDTVSTVDDTSVLVISNVVTSDSGDYICSATLTDTTADSMYIIDSEPDTATASVIVSK